MPREKSNKLLLSLIIIFCVIIGATINVVVALVVYDWNKYVINYNYRFENAFSLELPPNTTLVKKLSDRDKLGDGMTLYIFEIAKDEMDMFMNQTESELRNKLPILPYQFERIEESVSGSRQGRTFCALAKNISSGYYFFKETPMDALSGNSLSDTLLIFDIAVVDIDICYIYYLDVHR